MFPAFKVPLYAVDRFHPEQVGRTRCNAWSLCIPGWPVTAVLLSVLSVLSFLNETLLLLI